MSEQNAASGAGNSANSAGASGIAEPSNEQMEKAINEAVNKALGARMKRLNIDDQIAKAIEMQLAKMADTVTVEKEPIASGDHAASERPNMKALSAEMQQLKARLEASEKSRVEAEGRAVDARMRSEVHGELSKHLGADSPYLGPVMDSLYDVKKRFVTREDGSTGVRFKRDWGDEDVPLEQGFKELVQSDLKPYVQAKTAGLPPTGHSAYLRGQPITQVPRQDGNGVNKIMMEFARGLEAENPVVAAQLAQAAILPSKK